MSYGSAGCNCIVYCTKCLQANTVWTPAKVQLQGGRKYINDAWKLQVRHNYTALSILFKSLQLFGSSFCPPVVLLLSSSCPPLVLLFSSSLLLSFSCPCLVLFLPLVLQLSSLSPRWRNLSPSLVLLESSSCFYSHVCNPCVSSSSSSGPLSRSACLSCPRCRPFYQRLVPALSPAWPRQEEEKRRTTGQQEEIKRRTMRTRGRQKEDTGLASTSQCGQLFFPKREPQQYGEPNNL